MRNCAFTGCTNGDWKNKTWEKDDCPTHGCKKGSGACVCPPPVRLFTFPTKLRDESARLRWTKLVNRKNMKTGKNWQPSKDSRVCSCHFPDGQPTPANPDPILNLGYTVIGKKVPTRRSLPNRTETPPVKKQKVHAVNIDPLQDHRQYNYKCDCCDKCTCSGCISKQKTIESLRNQVENLKVENQSLKEQLQNVSSSSQKLSTSVLKTDRQVNNLTGLPTKDAFDKLYAYIEPAAKKLRYWRGEKKEQTSKSGTRKFTAKSPKRQGRKRKLDLREEFFLVLLKLRLALTMAFLSTLFDISMSTCSEIFNTWVKFLSRELAPLVFWPDRDVIRQFQPAQIKNSCKNLRAILDCTEIFIERPRHLRLQALTWSDYKKHSTALSRNVGSLKY